MDKKYIPSALVLYLNYFIHGIGCSILSQQVVKEMLASQWGLKDVMAVTSVSYTHLDVYKRQVLHESQHSQIHKPVHEQQLLRIF